MTPVRSSLPGDPQPAYRIGHYPATLIDVWTLHSGSRVTIRPVLPQDDGLLGDMIRRLSPPTRHSRFHGAVSGLSGDALRRMTQVDYRRHLALVVTTSDCQQERMVADARYYVDSEGDSAEFAIVVDDEWQRRGLAERAMRALSAAARQQGLCWLHGSVLSANAPMLSLIQRCAFRCTPDRKDDSLVHVEMRVDHAAPTAAPCRDAPWPMRWFASRRVAAAS